MKIKKKTLLEVIDSNGELEKILTLLLNITARKEKEKLRTEMKAIMSETGIRHGFAGDYEINWEAYEMSKLDKELLDPNAILAATKKVPAERLTIKFRKKDEDKPKKATRKKK